MNTLNSLLPLYTLLAIFGAIIGSFLNVVILRLPQEDTSIAFPPSHCPTCKTPLRWYMNIPIFSYLFLRGRCAHCKKRISLQYPIVELMTAGLAVAVFHSFGLSPASAAYFLFCSALLVIIFIDLHHQIIPDSISLPGIVLGFLFSLIAGSLSWKSSLIGILAGGGVLYAVAWIYYLLRKVDGLGGGDIKLLAMIGAWLGWQALPFVILFSSATGSLFGITTIIFQKRDSQYRIAFGPFLSVAALIYTFYSEKILHFYYLYLTGQWP